MYIIKLCTLLCCTSVKCSRLCAWNQESSTCRWGKIIFSTGYLPGPLAMAIICLYSVWADFRIPKYLWKILNLCYSEKFLLYLSYSFFFFFFCSGLQSERTHKCLKQNCEKLYHSVLDCKIGYSLIWFRICLQDPRQVQREQYCFHFLSPIGVGVGSLYYMRQTIWFSCELICI